MILIHTRTPARPKIYCENIRPLKITLARRSPGAPGPRRVSNFTPRDIFPRVQFHSNSNLTLRDIFLDSSPTLSQAVLSPADLTNSLSSVLHPFLSVSHLKQRFYSQKYLRRGLTSLYFMSENYQCWGDEKVKTT